MIPSRLSIIAMRKEMVKTRFLPEVRATLTIKSSASSLEIMNALRVRAKA